MNDFLLTDRIQKIKSVDEQYDLRNTGVLTFSGGMDSTCVHYLLDEALPGNKIPRVFINTGVEYKLIVDFFKEMQAEDDRFVEVKPTQNVKTVLETYGYPVKSKEFAEKVRAYRSHGGKTVYLSRSKDREISYLKKYVDEAGKLYGCPTKLLPVFQDVNYPSFSISNLCCLYLKKNPSKFWLKSWMKEHNLKQAVHMTGLRKSEGGTRSYAKCITINTSSNVINFKPILVVDDDFVDWYMQGKKHCKLYDAPYNFKRTGCKGCPFNPKLQKQLEVIEKFFPAERKQCDILFGKVYDFYREIGYRLT